MPETTVTGPDGNEYTVTHPAGATPEQIIAYARQQVASGALQADAPEPEVVEEVREPTVQDVIEATPTPLRSLANLPSSATNLYQQAVLDPLNDPLGALQGVGQLLGGTLQKTQDFLGENLGPVAGFSPITALMDRYGMDYRAAPEALVSHYGDRYGSPGAALETLQEDPAGLLADAAVVAPPVAGGRVSLANRARGTAEDVMTATVKPSTTIPRETRRAMSRTMLDEGINPSVRGIDVLQEAINTRARAVDDILANVGTEKTVALGDVLRPLTKLREERGASIAGGAEAAAAVDDFIRARVTDARRQGKTHLNVQELQQLKRDLYDQINWNARRQVDEVPVLEEARKVTARSAREQIENLAAPVAEENRQLGKLLELEPVLERAVNRIENRDVIGMSDFLGGGAGIGVGAATGNPALGTAIFAVSELFNNPKLAPFTARAIDKLGEATVSRRVDRFLRENPAASTAAIASYLESLSDDEALLMEEY